MRQRSSSVVTRLRKGQVGLLLMCGIAGIVGGLPRERSVALGRMIGHLGHRGPDGQGTIDFDGCSLGHTRLSIIDIKGGHQPFVFARPSGRLGLTFNGEIYGYKRLKRQLADFSFTSSSDTEVLLAYFLKKGPQVLSDLPGMFAFAFWDESSKELFCARDRFGEKPFYYAIAKSGEFLFASEVQALTASGLIDMEIDQYSLSHYLQRLYVPPNRTIFKNVNVLPPACSLSFRAGEVTVSRYWNLPEQDADIQLEEASERLRSILQRSIEDQLVADVPVGVFLSGGLDSTTITHLCKKSNPDISSYSFDFPGTLSERRFARDAANLIGTNHIEMSSASLDLAEAIPKALSAYGEPFADSSAIPTYFLCQQASKHTKVVLTGDAGDELFGGYGWYLPLFWMTKHKSPSFAKSLILRIVSRTLRTFKHGAFEYIEDQNVGAILARRHNSVAAAHHQQLKCFPDSYIRELSLPVLAVGLVEDGEDPLDSALRIDLVDYLPGDILTKIDRASMAHGLELRAPFLDWQLAEFCISLPSRLKISNSEDKMILRSTFEQVWPESIKTRRKQGFGAPVSEWLHVPAIREMTQELVWASTSPLSTMLDMSRIHEIREVLTDTNVWTLLCLALWHETVDFGYPSRGRARPPNSASSTMNQDTSITRP